MDLRRPRLPLPLMVSLSNHASSPVRTLTLLAPSFLRRQEPRSLLGTLALLALALAACSSAPPTVGVVETGARPTPTPTPTVTPTPAPTPT
ncbi:MAG: hypothetical protein F4Y25_11750, partial [Chloroflexi bacterium]|nr:hypothetical protein [Chloroflexota bacterium]